MVGDGQEIQWHAPLHHLAAVVHALAKREAIGILRRGVGAGRGGVEGIAGVQVQIAEVGVAQRIGRRQGACRDRRSREPSRMPGQPKGEACDDDDPGGGAEDDV